MLSRADFSIVIALKSSKINMPLLFNIFVKINIETEIEFAYNIIKYLGFVKFIRIKVSWHLLINENLTFDEVNKLFNY